MKMIKKMNTVTKYGIVSNEHHTRVVWQMWHTHTRRVPKNEHCP